jgi:phosphohistidine phosphatase
MQVYGGLAAHRAIIATEADGTCPAQGAIPQLAISIEPMIYFLRHGDAEHQTSDDAARELTEKGERQSEAAGRALAALEVSLDACLTSPKVRAERTAQLACEHLDVEPETAEDLRGGPFDPLELAAGRGDVLLVGHEPDFSNAVAELTGARVKLRKGGIAAVEDGQLHDLLRPKELRRIAGI